MFCGKKLKGEYIELRVMEEERHTRLLQRGNGGGTLKISAAPLQGDDAIEILIIHRHLVSSTALPLADCEALFSFNSSNLLYTRRKACRLLPFNLYFIYFLYLLSRS